MRVNTKPSGCFFRNCISSSERINDLSGDISATNIKSFLVSNLRHRLLLSPSDVIYEVTVETSQVDGTLV